MGERFRILQIRAGKARLLDTARLWTSALRIAEEYVAEEHGGYGSGTIAIVDTHLEEGDKGIVWRSKISGSRDLTKRWSPRGPVTHGVLNRYVIRFPNSNEAQNFHHSIGYVHLLEPARIGQIPSTFDGRTVIVYAYSRYYTKASMQKEAKTYGGKIVGSGRVLK